AGGVKGTLLAMLVDLLVATLTGSQFGFESDSLLDEEGNVPRVGQVFLFIDPAALAGQTTYFARMEALVQAMLADDGVRLPGDQRPLRRQAVERDGLQVPDALLLKLQQLAGASAG
ncbi:MAG: Ldh family oxidoreductase, partial [Hydrogenophaga sp.]